MPMVPLIGFAPDVDPTTPGAIVDCTSMIPSTRGMAAAESNVATSYPALADAVQGASLLVRLDGSVRFIVGTQSQLQEGIAGAWANVSRAGGYSAGEARWRMSQFGNDTLAANKSCVLQRSTGGTFADLVAPKCAFIEVVGGQALAANVDDTGSGLGTAYGDQPNAWWCSALNDCTLWLPSISTQAGRGLLVEAPGPITGWKRLGPYICAYKERALFLGRYVGANQGIWAFDLIPGDIGCASHEAIVNIGTAHFFVGPDDFYMFDGSRPVSIGAPLRKWFFARLSTKFRYKIAGLHDRANGRVWWFYPSSASSLGALDSAVVYDYRTQRWGVADRAVDMPVEVVLDGITYGNLGTLYSTYGSLPALSYGSPFWVSNAPIPAVIASDHKPYTLSGIPGAWSFKTGLQGDDTDVALVTRVNPRWITRPSSATLTNYYTMDEGVMVTTGVPITMSANSGQFDLLRAARWHQFVIAAVALIAVQHAHHRALAGQWQHDEYAGPDLLGIPG